MRGANKHGALHGSVDQEDAVASLVMTLVQIYYGVRLWKETQNRSEFDEVMGRTTVARFFTRIS